MLLRTTKDTGNFASVQISLYRPLQRLIQNLGHEPGRHQNYLEMISRNHRELTTQKDQLEQTLAEYRETLVRYREKEAAFREYPHGELNTLSRLLEENRFTEAGTLLEGLLTRFEQNGETDYFLGCILLDSLTVITNSSDILGKGFRTVM